MARVKRVRQITGLTDAQLALLYSAAVDGPIFGQVLGGPRPERTASYILSHPSEESEWPEWVGLKADESATPSKMRDRAKSAINFLLKMGLIYIGKVRRGNRFKYHASRKGRAWLDRAEREWRKSERAGAQKYKWNQGGDELNYYCPAMELYRWRGLVRKVGKQWKFKLTRPDKTESPWLKPSTNSREAAMSDCEATFAKYAKAS